MYLNNGTRQILVANILALAGALSFLGCEKSALSNDFEFKQTQLSGIQTDVKIPSQLWQKINSEYNRIQVKPVLVEEVKTLTRLHYHKVDAFLVERTAGILGFENQHLQGVQHGIFVDLSKWLKPQVVGEFYLALRPELPEKALKVVKAYFAPYYQSEQADGLSCGSYLEVTTFYLNEMKESGVLLTTLEDHHLRTIGGTFVFAGLSGDDIHVAQATIFDSKSRLPRCL